MSAVAILGSTGSIGTQALDVIRHFGGRFRVVSLAVGHNVDLAAEQVREFRPRLVATADAAAATALAERLGADAPEIRFGAPGLLAVATHAEADSVLTSVVGVLGLEPTLAAIAAGKRILLANKETLVAAGRLVTEAARRAGVEIIPVDSEHNALFQCLSGHDISAVRRLVLTASGGPFLGLQRGDLARATPEQALRHPRWQMGPKVTVDSATLMNKALELIEAHHLFGVPMERIEVLIHPQSIVHSLVEFVDGSVLAQLGVTDMRLPIQHALCYPERCPGPVSSLDLVGMGSLTFLRPDEETFPSLLFARRAVTMEGTAPAVLNAANEVAVDRFLNRDIRLTDIFRIVGATLAAHRPGPALDLPVILKADAWARQFAASFAIEDGESD